MNHGKSIIVLLTFLDILFANDFISPLFSGNAPTYEPVSINQREIKLSTATPHATLLTAKQLNLSVPCEGFFTVNIVSITGRKLFTRTFALSSGDRTVFLDGFSAPDGFVLVDIAGAGVRSTQKMSIK